MAAAVPAQNPTTAPRNAAVRYFGRFQLLRLIGKSERTMAWSVADPRSGQDMILVLPRTQPAEPAALERWTQALRKASRVSHPNLAPVVEMGVQDGWPFAAYDPNSCATMAERASHQGLPGTEVAAWMVQALQGLAFAHEAGVAHHDIQPYLLLVSDSGNVRLAGLEVACEEVKHNGTQGNTGGESGALRSQRLAAEHDVLALGLVLHHLLVGEPALEEPDTGRVIQRLPPLGRDIVRLPWSGPRPIAEPLRVIVNRATERQERQRYRNARTLARALEGWLQAEADGSGGALALLLDRLHSVGVLPSAPGAAAQAARLAMMERERTNELAEVVLQDMALAFELLRNVNSAQVRGGAGSGPVLTVRRAIAMLGMEGVRRAALALRPWPGPLNEVAAAELQRLVQRVRRAARLALLLRPPGYDGEVIYLLTLLQNLGRLVVQYHFADEAQQIRRLMQPAVAAQEGEPVEPGMAEEAASLAVLGVDVESIGAAVARLWGLDDTVLHMIRRMPLSAAPRSADTDDEMLRAVASCANETVDGLNLGAAQTAAALQRVVQRYGRLLGLTLRDLQAALQAPASDAVGEQEGDSEPHPGTDADR